MFLLANGPAITIFDVIIITISIFKNFKHLEFYLKYTGLIVKYKNIFLLILIGKFIVDLFKIQSKKESWPARQSLAII